MDKYRAWVLDTSVEPPIVVANVFPETDDLSAFWKAVDVIKEVFSEDHYVTVAPLEER